MTLGSLMRPKKHRGLFHRDTGTPMGQKIPAAKITAALHSPDVAVRKRANFARNAAKWNG